MGHLGWILVCIQGAFPNRRRLYSSQNHRVPEQSSFDVGSTPALWMLQCVESTIHRLTTHHKKTKRQKDKKQYKTQKDKKKFF
jgi:hypothetical protein